MKNYVEKKNEKRMISQFVEFAKIASLSKKEGRFAKVLAAELKKLGAKVIVDGAAKKIGGETGNVIGLFPGTVKAPPILFCSHMDTVTPGENIKPIVKKDKIHTDGSTIVAADCKSGIVAILEMVRVLKENKIPHPPLEIVFTAAEEVGLQGAKNLDYSKLKAKEGVVLDNLSPEKLIIKAPSVSTMNIKIHGVAAHSGIAPEGGVSAIEVLAKAISFMKLGRIDHETTANIGIVHGGNARNIVMPLLEISAEARSHSPAKLKKQIEHMKGALEKAVALSKKAFKGQKLSAKLEFNATIDYPNMDIPPNAPCVKRVVEAGKCAGVKIETGSGGGGCDANVFNSKGIKIANLGCGMNNAHTTNEFLNLKDFFNCARVIIAYAANCGK